MYIWLNTILQGGGLTPETPPLRTPMYAYNSIGFNASVLELQRVSASAFKTNGTASFSFSQRRIEREKKLYNELMVPKKETISVSCLAA